MRMQAREASEETRPADTLNLDFQSPKLPLFKPLSLWYFVTLALATEKAMAPYSSTLAWRIPWTEEPGGLQSMGSPRVGHD